MMPKKIIYGAPNREATDSLEEYIKTFALNLFSADDVRYLYRTYNVKLLRAFLYGHKLTPDEIGDSLDDIPHEFIQTHPFHVRTPLLESLYQKTGVQLADVVDGFLVDKRKPWIRWDTYMNADGHAKMAEYFLEHFDSTEDEFWNDRFDLVYFRELALIINMSIEIRKRLERKLRLVNIPRGQADKFVNVHEIKERADIVEVAGMYTRLSKAGRNFSGLCPFHSEKHPSFIVSPDRKSWHCFGACNTGGDVISLVMKAENCDFKAACTLLERK